MKLLTYATIFLILLTIEKSVPQICQENYIQSLTTYHQVPSYRQVLEYTLCNGTRCMFYRAATQYHMVSTQTYVLANRSTCCTGYTGTPPNCTDINECDDIPCHHNCTNLEGGFECSCYSGYVMNRINGTCADINECALSLCEHNCTNNEGSFECNCTAGFTLGDDQRSCEDIDECLSHPCHQICVNTNGSYNCSCRPGYELHRGVHCDDINECDELPYRCDHGCINHPGSFNCTCREGYMLDVDNRSCIDVNECDTLQFACERNCTNTIGSYECQCNSGYVLNADGRTCDDINECRVSAPCQHNCTNTIGGYQCSCIAGYTANGAFCEDNNECNNTPRPCEDLCINTPGSYQCACTNISQMVNDDGRCIDFNECEISGICDHYCNNTNGGYYCLCRSGYRLVNGHSCIDIDECQLVPALCEQNCTNYEGSHECSCDMGYVLDNDMRTCNDIDECYPFSPCHHTCTNSEGSFECSCLNGFQLVNETNCTDIDECTSSPCGHNCTNTNGSFVCFCNVGYELNEDQYSCDDIDECTVGHLCDHTCNNTEGSYRCGCRSGYMLMLDGMMCRDINECVDDPGICGDICINTMGSYNCSCSIIGEVLTDDGNCTDHDECVAHPCERYCHNRVNGYYCSCDEGYQLVNGTNCTDIDECEEPSPCDQGCTNTNGSYECSCYPGYELDENGWSCNDIDECHVGFPCHQQCNNTVGSYRCSCYTGYALSMDDRCIDINECDVQPSLCEHNCTNTLGSYECFCLAGYELFRDNRSCVDIDECRTASPCDHTCNNTVGSYRCGCYGGYELHEDGDRCIDINECNNMPPPCEGNCTNTAGSYECSCSDLSQMVAENGACVDFDVCSIPGMCSHICNNTNGGYFCSCPLGYRLVNGHNCTDINECEMYVHACDHDHYCNNTEGSFECSCRTGYVLDSNQVTCSDFDECANGYPCDQICTNTEGSFSCSCYEGYTLNGTMCNDTDECLDMPCGDVCNNTIGSYQCSCSDNFRELIENGNCVELPGCQLYPGICEHNCTSVYGGGYYCSCAMGYQLVNGHNCTDIDECADPNTCSHICTNTNGSYECSCFGGYALSSDRRSCISLSVTTLEHPTVRYHNSALSVILSWMAPSFNNEEYPVSSYRLVVRFHDRVLTNSPNISADVTSIDMSHYFPSHPQYYLTYNITVQALHGDEMVVANVSKHVIARTFVLQECNVSSTSLGAIRATCDFLGNPRTLNATVMRPGHDPITIIGVSPIEVSNLSAADYTVEVFAVNASGERLEDSTIVKMITVFAAPAEALLNVDVQVTSSRSILLTWRPPRLVQINGVLNQYQLELRETKILHYDNGTTVLIEGVNRNISLSASGNLTQLISGLHPNYHYTVRIAAETTIGIGMYSSAMTVTTLEDVPSEPPQNIRVTDVNSSTIRLSWEPPPPESQNGQLMYYHVIITETKVVNLENRTVSFLMGFNITSRYEISQGRVQLITELHPSYRYSFKISAATSAGIGVYSSSMNVTLMEGAPTEAPVIVSLTAPSPHSIMLSWEPPSYEYHNGQIVEYHVEIGQIVYVVDQINPFDINIKTVKYDGRVNHTQLIDELPEHHNYTVRIAAATSEGIGPFSEPILVTTLENVCNQDYDSGIIWRKERSNGLANVNCSDLHPSFQPGVNITRKCLDNREWGNVDFSGCTMKPGSTLLIMVEVESSSITSEATMIRNDVVESISEMYRFLNFDYSVSMGDIIIIFFVSNDRRSAVHIAENVLVDFRNKSYEVLSVTAFQPSTTCLCNNSKMAGSVYDICVGINAPPCINTGQVFECIEPYVGDGETCSCPIASCATVEETDLFLDANYIGLAVLAVCLLITIAALVLFKHTTLKEKHNLVHLNLVIALFLAVLVFAIGIETANNNEDGCVVVATFIHYLILVTFCWTMCELTTASLMMFTQSHTGFIHSIYLLVIISWGIPLPIAVISAIAAHDDYGIYDSNDRKLCWFSNHEGVIWAFIVPVILILLVDIFLLSLLLFKIFKLKRERDEESCEDNHEATKARHIVWSMLVLLPLIGVTWILGLVFVVNEESDALAAIFIVLNSLQGIAIVFFFVLRNEEVIKGAKGFIDRNDQGLTSDNVRSNHEGFLLRRPGDNDLESIFTENSKETTGCSNKAFENDDDNAPLTSHNTSTTNNRKGASGYNNMHDGDDNRAPLKYATHDAKLGDKEAESSFTENINGASGNNSKSIVDDNDDDEDALLTNHDVKQGDKEMESTTIYSVGLSGVQKLADETCVTVDFKETSSSNHKSLKDDEEDDDALLSNHDAIVC